MKVLRHSIVFIFRLLTQRDKKKAIGISILLFINSGLELLGLSAIFPIFVVLLENDVVENHAWASWIYDAFSLNNENQLTVLLSVGLFLAFLIKNILSLLIVKTQTKFSASLFKDLLLRMHKFYYKKGFTFFKETNSMEIIRDIKGATEKFAQTIMQSTITLINELVILIVIFVVIAIYNFQVIALLTVTVLPITVAFYFWIRKKSLKLSEITLKIDPIIWTAIYESIKGYIDVIIAGTERNFRKNINKKAEVIVDLNIKSTVYNLAPAKVIETSLMLAICLIVSYGIYFLPSKTDLIKLLGLFVIAGYRIIPSISKIMISFNGLNQSNWVFNILEPLTLKNIDMSEKVVARIIEFKNKLELRNVSFSFPNNRKNILENICLKIPKGGIIGIVGDSGAGKTTLMNILLGFLKPTKGFYYIDEEELCDENLDSFYKMVGYVQQEVYLIDGSLAENVAFGISNELINKEKLAEALERASLKQFVQGLPNGVLSQVGENGTKLSGGQRQRVGIARALYFGAEILFFDEATSALDDKTEKEITEAINNLSKGKITIVIIAHRLTTLINCDKIYKLSRNSVLSEHSYKDLIKEVIIIND